MKKVVLVANASWTMLKFRGGLMKKLLEKGYDVYVISPYDRFSEDICKIGCKHIDINISSRGVNVISDIRLLYNLYKLYKKISPDLIFHYTIKPNIYGSFAARMLGLKTISVIPGLGSPFIYINLLTIVVSILYKASLNIPVQVWFVNFDDRDEFVRRKLVNEKKTKVINGEGVNLDIFKPFETNKKSKKFVFLLIARIFKDKGVYEYAEAAKIIKKKREDVEFQILGSLNINDPSSIKIGEVNSWVNDGVFTYLGEASDVRKFIAKSNCVVLPSYREGKGMTLVEGASMMKPLIATNVPGCKDVVDDGINGLLCKVMNSSDLSDKMEMMMNFSEKERRMMGKAGREKMMKEFDEKMIIKQYIETIVNII